MIDTKLYLIAVYLLIFSHELDIGYINCNNCLRFKFLVYYILSEEIVAAGEYVIANHPAANIELCKYLFQTKSCTYTVTVGIAVSDDNGIFAVSEEGLCLAESNIHRVPPLHQIVQLLADLCTSFNRVVGNEGEIRCLPHFEPVEKLTLYKALCVFESLDGLLCLFDTFKAGNIYLAVGHIA